MRDLVAPLFRPVRQACHRRHATIPGAKPGDERRSTRGWPCATSAGAQRSGKQLWVLREWKLVCERDGRGAQGSAPPPERNMTFVTPCSWAERLLTLGTRPCPPACLAQRVNVIARLSRRRRLLRQTTYYPYAWTLAHHAGTAGPVVYGEPTTWVVVPGPCAVPGCGRHVRSFDRGGLHAGPQPRHAEGARAGDRLARGAAHAGSVLRDADRSRPHGAEHVRRSEPHCTEATCTATPRSPMAPSSRRALLHRADRSRTRSLCAASTPQPPSAMQSCLYNSIFGTRPPPRSKTDTPRGRVRSRRRLSIDVVSGRADRDFIPDSEMPNIRTRLLVMPAARSR